MNLRRHFMLMMAVVMTATVTESSHLLRRSLLRPEDREPCFSCRPEERPFMYPLIAQFAKFKDEAVKVFKAIVAGAKEQLN